MKRVFWIVLLAAGYYLYSSGYLDRFLNVSPPATAKGTAGGPAVVREIESRPAQIMGMQDAMGSGGSGSAAKGYADTARNAVNRDSQ